MDLSIRLKSDCSGFEIRNNHKALSGEYVLLSAREALALHPALHSIATADNSEKILEALKQLAGIVQKVKTDMLSYFYMGGKGKQEDNWDYVIYRNAHVSVVFVLMHGQVRMSIDDMINHVENYSQSRCLIY